MSFPAYPDYQDSGIAWVGAMPVHWGVKQLKWLFDLQKRPVRDEDEIVTAFRDGIVTLRKHRREEGFTNSLKEIGYQGIRKGDLVIHAMDGFAGAIGVSDSDGKSTPVYSVCKPKEGSLSEYYGRLLRYMALSGFVDSLAKGVRERSTEFRWRDASVLPLPVPPMGEQRAIVQFLDRETAKIDALVAEQERLIALLKGKRQAVISHAVTKGLDPDAPMKDSGIEWLGEIPAHWEIVKIVRLFRASKGKEGQLLTKEYCAEHNGEYPVYSGQTENHGVMGTLDRYEFDAGDAGFLFSTTVGAKAMSVSHIFGKFSLSQNCMIIRPTSASAHPRFYYYHFQQAFAHHRAMIPDHMQPSFRMDDLYGFQVAVPPVSEQIEIARYLDEEHGAHQGLISEAQQAISLLKERRAALISAAVTGKIDVHGRIEQHEMEAA